MKGVNESRDLKFRMNESHLLRDEQEHDSVEHVLRSVLEYETSCNADRIERGE